MRARHLGVLILAAALALLFLVLVGPGLAGAAPATGPGAVRDCATSAALHGC